MIGIAAGQTARVNALNLGTSSSTQNSSCGVTLQLLDTQGQVLKQTVVILQPGKAAFLDLNRDQAPLGDARVEIRAVLLFGYFGGAPPTPGILQNFDCNIVPSVEVYDGDTGKTSFILTETRALPGPASPAQ